MNSHPAMEQSEICWRGDLDDDCTAEWHGLLLRAEWQYGEGADAFWWWSVFSIETGEELESSNYQAHKPNTGEDARKCAEAAARRYFESLSSSLFRHTL